jgi:hypothetical protein
LVPNDDQEKRTVSVVVQAMRSPREVNVGDLGESLTDKVFGVVAKNREPHKEEKGGEEGESDCGWDEAGAR